MDGLHRWWKGVKPKPVEPEPRTDLSDNTESEQKLFEEMEERRRLQQSDQQEQED